MHRKFLLMIAAVCCLNAAAATVATPIGFITYYEPSEEEISTLFNLQAYLAQYNDDIGRDPDMAQFLRLATLSTKYNILQTYMFEAFIQNTQNKKATQSYREFAAGLVSKTNDVERNIALMDRPPAPNTKGQSPTYRLANGNTAEWIDLFELGELTIYGGRLHSMIFTKNNWSQIGIENDPTVVGFTCGGGTNSFLMMYRRYQLDLDEFIRTKVNNDFHSKKYENWNCSKLKPIGILLRAAADEIYFGQGATIGWMDIKESTIALYYYSKKYAEGYEITWMMNFSKPNAFYDEPERIWHQLAETLLLSWVD